LERYLYGFKLCGAGGSIMNKLKFDDWDDGEDEDSDDKEDKSDDSSDDELDDDY